MIAVKNPMDPAITGQDSLIIFVSGVVQELTRNLSDKREGRKSHRRRKSCVESRNNRPEMDGARTGKATKTCVTSNISQDVFSVCLIIASGRRLVVSIQITIIETPTNDPSRNSCAACG